MIILNLQKSYEIEKYKTISRVSYNHRSERPTPTSSAAKMNVVIDAEPPPMQDLGKHHR
jgi:hypothetical protein